MTWTPEPRLSRPPAPSANSRRPLPGIKLDMAAALFHPFLGLAAALMFLVLVLPVLVPFLSYSTPFHPPPAPGMPEAAVVEQYGPPQGNRPARTLESVPGMYEAGEGLRRASEIPELPGASRVLWYHDDSHRALLVFLDGDGRVIRSFLGHLR